MSPAHLFEFDSLREDDQRFKIIQHYKSKDEGRKNPSAIRVSVNGVETCFYRSPKRVAGQDDVRSSMAICREKRNNIDITFFWTETFLYTTWVVLVCYQ